MSLVDSHVAVVTGAGSGIGSAIARRLAKDGARIFLYDLDPEKLSKITADIISSGCSEKRIGSMVGDVSSSSNMKALFEACLTKFDDLSLLVNNAGITRDGLLMRMKDDDWDAVLEVNMTASMSLCRAAMRGMMKAKTGRIISISSVVGVTGNPGQTNYAASKAGMIGFSKSLAAEVASRGLTVNVVAPGFIETPMTDVLDESQKTGLLSRVPAGRLGQADEIAAAVVFLASDEASYITGATLHVNGGMAML